ncbi:hypothetical protein IJ750_06235 [bacterium]|nr:hypothetical protein [bacterium]
MVVGFMSMLPPKTRQVNDILVRVVGEFPKQRIECTKVADGDKFFYSTALSNIKDWANGITAKKSADKKYVILSNGKKVPVRKMPEAYTDTFEELKSEADKMNEDIMTVTAKNLTAVKGANGLPMFYTMTGKFPPADVVVGAFSLPEKSKDMKITFIG